MGAAHRQQPRSGLANAARSAGDDNDFSLLLDIALFLLETRLADRTGCERTVRFEPSRAVDQNSFLLA